MVKHVFKKFKNVSIVFSFLTFFLVFGLAFLGNVQIKDWFNSSAYAESSTAEKKKTKSTKAKAVPKVADAALAGWIEDKETVYIREGGLWSIYIYSRVRVPDPTKDRDVLDSMGYFRVVTLNSLEFAKITAPPYIDENEPPIKVVKDGVTTLVVLYNAFTTGNRISIFNDKGGLYNEIYIGSKKPIFEDLDGDGKFETMAYGDIRELFTASDGEAFYERVRGPVISVDIGDEILEIFRYANNCECFRRVKGKNFERYFLDHARNLIEKKYPKWLGKAKADSFDIKTRRQLNWIIGGWLATVESTHNPELIREALNKLKELPYPSEEEKQKILEKLIQNGYPMLKTN
ncbi:MAG: hypothetical protein HY957_01990 [Nitrospirae bacterium]|nr:hypothetical protein [Nitrospirota bacterium]